MFKKFKKSEEINNEAAVNEVTEVKTKKGTIPKVLVGVGLVAAGLFTGKLLKSHNDKINKEYYPEGSDEVSDYGDSGDSEEE